MNKLFFFTVGILMVLILNWSCVKEPVICNEPIETVNACEKEIDKSIVMDTVWHFEQSGYNTKFSDKYFTISDENGVSFYSVESGELTSRIEDNDLFDEFKLRMQLKGDYAIANTPGLEPVIYKYNIVTKEVQKSASINFLWPYVFEKDAFYGGYKNKILKLNYEGEVLDTVYEIKGVENFDEKEIKIYHSSNDSAKDYLIIIYEESDSKIFSFRLIDLSTKKLLKTFDFSFNGIIYRFDINEGIVTVTAWDMLFAYDINSRRHYLISDINYGNLSKAFAMATRPELNPMIFYTNNDKFTAYDFKTNRDLWDCDCSEMNFVNPVDIHDTSGNQNTYLLYYKNSVLFGLMDPLTGIVKSEIELPFNRFPNIKVYNNDEIIIKNDDTVAKIKIRKIGT